VLGRAGQTRLADFRPGFSPPSRLAADANQQFALQAKASQHKNGDTISRAAVSIAFRLRLLIFCSPCAYRLREHKIEIRTLLQAQIIALE
jgi:hypothetical protein